ncbi:MAG: hypothetical protein M3Y59_19880 [Myxococcota bacterium]|nr:hypothetical protein [Myxococcota bacterium]
MRVTVISYSKVLDHGIEHTALKVKGDSAHEVLRCQRPHQILYELANVGQPITLLDLHGHGGPGFMNLGDDRFVDWRWRGMATLTPLRPYLAADAKVRLLGCHTALGEEGRELLVRSSAELGGLLVYGTLVELLPRHFEERGLSAGFASRWLQCSGDLG